MKSLIPKEKLGQWARILLSHSLGGIKPGMRVMIKGEAVCWPLIAELEAQVVAAGGLPDVNLIGPNNDRGKVWSAAMGQFGTEEQVAAIPDWHRLRYEAMDAYVEVLGMEDPSQFTMLTGAQAQILARADLPFRTIRGGKPWVLTLYPTAHDAEFEDFSLQEYAEFLVEASLSDPNALVAAQEALAPLFDRAKTMTIRTRMPGCEELLELKVHFYEGSHSKACWGQCNWPDGERFRSPDPRFTTGEIYLDLPVCYQGQTIQGIYLKFEDGKAVDFSAKEGNDVLKSIIETDQGSCRLGEAALGMNPGLSRVLKSPLYVEKVGGTLHIALGSSYEDCFVDAEGAKQAGAFNQSAQHVDIVCDFRTGGAGVSVHLDDTLLVVLDNQWVVSQP